MTRLVSDATDKTKFDLQEQFSKKSLEAQFIMEGRHWTEKKRQWRWESLETLYIWFSHVYMTVCLSLKTSHIWFSPRIYEPMFQSPSVENLWLVHGSWGVLAQQTENHWFLTPTSRKEQMKGSKNG